MVISVSNPVKAATSLHDSHCLQVAVAQPTQPLGVIAQQASD
jgi:hypothetical protein